MSRNFSNLGPTVFLFFTLGFCGLVASSSPANAGEDKPCTTKKFQSSEVEKACKTGGRTAAKALMKKWVKQAKAAGQKVVCKDCHKDLKSFEPTADSADKFSKFLASLETGDKKQPNKKSPDKKPPENNKPAEKKTEPKKK